MQEHNKEHPLFIPAVLREGHSDTITHISCYDYLALSCSTDNSVILWDLEKQKMLFIAQFTAPIAKAVLAKPTKFLVSIRNEYIQCWNTSTSGLEFQIALPENKLFSDFSAIEDFTCIISGDIAYVYENEVLSFEIRSEGVNYTTVHLRRGYVALGREDGMFEVWDLEQKARIGFVVAHAGKVTSVVLTEYHLVSAGQDDLVIVWDLVSFAEIHRFSGIGKPSILAGSSTHVLVGSEHGVAKIWTLQNFELKATLLGHTNALSASGITDKGILTGDETGGLRFWDAEIYRELRVVPPIRQPRQIVANRNILALYDGAVVEIYEYPASEPTFHITPPRGEVERLSINEDVLFLVDRRRVYTYDLVEFKPIKLLKRVRAKDISPPTYPTPLVIGASICLVFSYEKEKEFLSEAATFLEETSKIKEVTERIEFFLSITESGYPVVRYTEEITWLIELEWIARFS